MVLAGTALTACVAYFLFPYGWSFNLAMTFGAILSATDVAAVAALMSSLGAPPRLQMLMVANRCSMTVPPMCSTRSLAPCS